MLQTILAITQLYGCFQDSVIVAYSLNLKTADLTLQPNSSSSCGFGYEVNLTLIFDGVITPQSFIYDSFDQSKEQAITMKNISIPDSSVVFAYLNISTLNYFTMVRVMELRWLKS